MKNIVIFASGGGSNAEKIMQHFSANSAASVVAVFCNNTNAGVLKKADEHKIPAFIFSREELSNGFVLRHLQAFNPHLIVLAGFLLRFPADIIAAYPHKVINIHPALLPKYGGKGMYGMHVHRAVLENKEPESGITVHYVDENYDEGNIIFQKAIAIEECLSPEAVATKVLTLEHEHFAKVIEDLIRKIEN